MMQTSDKPMLEQVLWFLGNVCGEDKKLQEIIIGHTCLFAVLQSLIDTSRISRSLLRTICWVNSNIGRYRNLNRDQIRIVVAIAKAGLFCEDDSIASDSLWSIAYVADTHDDDVIETMAEQDLLNMLVSKLASADTSHFIPALRAVGNILTCSNAEVVERCLFADVISGLTGLLMQTSTPVIKEALWSFSNITAGPCTHVRAFAESNAFDRILVLSESRNLDLKKEALLVLTNLRAY